MMSEGERHPLQAALKALVKDVDSGMFSRSLYLTLLKEVLRLMSLSIGLCRPCS